MPANLWDFSVTGARLDRRRTAGRHRHPWKAPKIPGERRRDLRAIKLSGKDVVAGICASGTTPYVLAALRYASPKAAPLPSPSP